MALDLKNIDLKNMDLKNIYEWPIYGRLLVFGLVCVAVFYCGYFFDFSGLSGQIYKRFKLEKDLKQQVRSILKTEEDMKEVVTQFPQVLKLLSQWQGQLSNYSNLPDLLNQILKIGVAEHLQFFLFAPDTKKQINDFSVVPIKVVVQGNYNQVANFISQLANLPQIVAINDFAILAQPKAGGTGGEKQSEEASVAGNLTTSLALGVYYLADKK